MIGGGLVDDASLRLRFGVDGRSGWVGSNVGSTVVALEFSLDLFVFLTPFPERFLISIGLLVELTG